MSFFRRRSSADQGPSTPPPTRSTSEASVPSVPVAPVKIPAHIERALITLTTKMQSCIERLDTIEHRLDELAETTMNAPSHSDVLEVRMHSAKLAAELARATVELRGEIGMASDEARRAARLTRNLMEEDVPVSLPVDVDLGRPAPQQKIDIGAEERKDESSGSDAKPGPGWSASA